MSWMPGEKERMRLRFIETPYLLRSLILFGGILFTACFICYAVLYIRLSWGGGQFLSGTPQEVQVLRIWVGGLVWFAVFLYGIICAILLLAAALFVTHRVAGPLVHMEKMAEGALTGRIPQFVRLRRGDQLISLAEGQEKLLSLLGGKEKALSALLGEAEGRKKRLASLLGAPQAEWLKEAQALRENLGRLEAEAGRGLGTVQAG